jgi:hypothetical protein
MSDQAKGKLETKDTLKSSSTLWERKGNLTSKPPENPIPPQANIGGSGSGKVSDSGTADTPPKSGAQ